MRRVASKILQSRKHRILSEIIHYYIKTGKPVSSNMLTNKCNLSASTIRNLMANLETEGYLMQPYTSAGRLPTDKGYRLYVDNIKKIQNFALVEEDRIKKEYVQQHKEIETLLSDTSRILAVLSKYAGFVIAPKTQYDEIKNIEVIQISKEDILFILLTKSGRIKHKKVSGFLKNDQLYKLKKILNNKLRGIAITLANKTLASELTNKYYDTTILKIIKEISRVFCNIQDDIYIDGTANVIGLPDPGNFENIKCLMEFNNNKKKFMEAIDLKNDVEMAIKIGSENSLKELKNLSIVTKVYKSGTRNLGILGIIGPKRMEYQKMILLVNYISDMLNKFFKDIFQ
ncbi:MAG: heat-inducible transcriptional repressor HrcA [Endomicrobium sp.]|jgi:heat-inducible transcriptional repressor|nr:heat-inducible transcriptional repressor HrcA [Endomicrobium sp.]